jgi:hypothetical protein
MLVVMANLLLNIAGGGFSSGGAVRPWGDAGGAGLCRITWTAADSANLQTWAERYRANRTFHFLSLGRCFKAACASS